MRLAHAMLPVLLVAAVLAGCLQSPPPAPVAHGWTLDCSLGQDERNLGAGHDWAQDCEARASHTPGHKQEVWLAVNPRDPNNVIVGAKDLNAALSADCVWNGIFVTHDGGLSWHDVYISGQYADRGPTSPFYGYACNTDPMGVFTPDGTAHWVVEMYNLGGSNGFGPLGADPQSGRGIMQPGWKLVLAHSPSDKGGDEWPADQVTTLEYGDGVGILNDYSRVTMNPKTSSVVTVINTYYPAAGSNALPLPYAGEVCSVLAYRGPGQPVQAVPVQPTFATGTANPGQLNCTGIAASANGTLVLAAEGTGVPTSSLNGPTGPVGTGPVGFWFSTSTDDGRTWGDFTHGFDVTPIPGQFPESSYRTGTNFELAIDQSNATTAGTLYALYAADGRNATAEKGGDDADVYLRASHDGGRTWGDASRVNNNVTGHQFEGNLAVAGDGSVHVFFMDKQYDTTGAPGGKSAGGQPCTAHCLIDITYARSVDGGRTWTNHRVTTVGFDGDLGKHQEGFPFIGDYTGAGASGNTVYGAFPDASNGKVTVIAAAKVVKRP